MRCKELQRDPKNYKKTQNDYKEMQMATNTIFDLINYETDEKMY